jgi:hypothetical protein
MWPLRPGRRGPVGTGHVLKAGHCNRCSGTVKAEYQCQQWIDREIALYSCCVIIIQIAVRVIDVQQLVTQIDCAGCEEEYAEQGKDAKSGISSNRAESAHWLPAFCLSGDHAIEPFIPKRAVEGFAIAICQGLPSPIYMTRTPRWSRHSAKGQTSKKEKSPDENRSGWCIRISDASPLGQ